MAKIVKKFVRFPDLPALAPSADNQLTPRTTADNLLTPRSAGASTHRLQSVLNSSTTPNKLGTLLLYLDPAEKSDCTDDTTVRLFSTFQAIFEKADADGRSGPPIPLLLSVIYL